MKVSFKAICVGLIAGSVWCASVPMAYAVDEPENIIKYRKNVMKAQAAHITNIAAVVKGEVSFAGNIAADAAALVDLSQIVAGIFPEGTDAGKTNALPKIWEDRAGFEEAAQKSAAAAAAMVEAAATNDIGAISAALGALGKTCGGCHKPYRKEM